MTRFWYTLKNLDPFEVPLKHIIFLHFRKNLTIELFQVAWKQWWTSYIRCAGHGLWDIISIIWLSIMKNNAFMWSWCKLASWRFGLQWISLFFLVVHVSHEPFFFYLDIMFFLTTNLQRLQIKFPTFYPKVIVSFD
jgi:hypothetical protein